MLKRAGKFKLRRTIAATPKRSAFDRASSPPHKRPDYVNFFAIVISIIALLVSVWMAYEGRQNRLDVKRTQLRSEALNVLQELRSVVNKVNCYALVMNVETTGKDELMHFLADQENRLREGLVDLNEYSPDELTIYEKSLNAVKGRFANLLNERLVLLRMSMDKQLLERSDSMCEK